MHRLPSLAALPLGTNFESSHLLQDTPPELLVEQAAVNAEQENYPAKHIGKWMKTFCRLHSDLACDDHLYRIALAAFGVPTKEACTVEFTVEGSSTGNVAATGNSTLLPVKGHVVTPFKNWRGLFWQLCEAFYGELFSSWEPGKRRLETGEPTFWGDVRELLHARFLPWSPELLLRRKMSQRDMDALLDVLVRYLQSPVRNLDEKGVWTQWMSGGGYPYPSMQTASPLMALVTLFVMRGATPFKSEIYGDLDRKLSNVIGRGMKEGQDALDEMKQILEDGGDPNYVEDGGGPNYTGEGQQSMLMMAVRSLNGGAIKLLLENGASVRPHTNWRGLLDVVLTSIKKPGWSADQETTKTLLGMLKPRLKTALGTERMRSKDSITSWLLTVEEGGSDTNVWLIESVASLLTAFDPRA